MSAKGYMQEAGPCPEVYPDGLNRGEVHRCEKTNRHYKHQWTETWRDNKGLTKSGPVVWRGIPNTPEERAEAERIESMGQGGVDPFKQLAWTMDLVKKLGVV